MFFHLKRNKKIHHHLPFNKSLEILLFTNALVLVAGAMLGPIYAIFVQNIGGDLLDASYAGGIYAIVASITVFFFGKLSDRIKENEMVVVLGYLIIALGFFSYIFVNSIWSLLLVQAIIGFGEAIYSPPFDALYSKHLSSQRAGTQWGAWESMNYFTIALGALLGGLIANVFGFKALFMIMGVISLISAIYIYKLPRKIL